MKSNFFELAALLSLVSPTEVERTACEQLFHQTLTNAEIQEQFFNYCLQWKLAPWVRLQLETFHLWTSLTESVREQFETQYLAIREQNIQRNETARVFLNRFTEEQIPVAILKGNCFAHTIYQDPGYKRMNDFDILIRKEDWDRIQTIYLELGYIPLGFGWSGEKEKPASFSHVGMSFISPDYSCIIGSQWGLKSPTTSYKDHISEVWKTALPFDFYGVPVQQLSPESNLLHLILHMGIYKCSIRDCMDVSNLLRTHAIDIPRMVSLLKASNAIEKAVFTLEMTELSAPGCAQELLRELQPKKGHFLMRRLAKRKQLHAKTGDYQLAYNDYFQDVEKDVIYFNLFHQFHLKCYFYFKILKRIYFPKRKYLLKLNDLDEHASFFQIAQGRWIAPGRIFALIAQEIGWKFTILLFVKLGIDTLFSIKNYLIPKKSYFDYLKSRNIDPKTIEKVVKNIQ